MEAHASRDDGMAALDNKRRHEKRLQKKRHRAGIRCRIRLTGPGTETGVRDRSAVVMGGRFRIGMIDYAGD